MKKIKGGGRFSSDALMLMLIKLMTIALSFLVTRLLSQHLSTHDYGTYSQILLIGSTVSSLTILGMMDGINYFFCSEREEGRREAYIATLFSMQCVASLAAGALVLALGGAICRGFGNADLKKLLFFGAALPLLQNLVSMLQILMISLGKARMIALRNLIVSLARLAAVLVVIALVKNVAVILLTTLALDVAQIGIFLWILRKNGCLVRLGRTDFRLSGRILRYCVPMAVFTMLGSLNRDCDKYLIGLMTDTETLAVYANASKVLPFDIVMSSFCTVLLPEITRQVSAGEKKAAAALYRKFLEIALISTGILCCSALAAAPQLMELLYSRKYLTGLTVFCIYILVDLFRFTNITLILSAAGRTARLMVVGIGTLAVNAGLNVLLYKLLGLSGPAWATLITTLLTGVVMLSLGARELDAAWKDFFDGRFLLRFGAGSFLVTAIFAGFRQWLTAAGMPWFWTLLLVGGGCCGCLLLGSGKRLLQALKGING